ncbi:MAG: hypothetical protein DRP12_03670, partial [Candidatus Aenigmatarchaeota archaeon]
IPGYITEEITQKGKKLKIRNLNLPENLFSELEKIAERKNFSKYLYVTGKNFSYHYGSCLDLPKINAKNFKSFVPFFVKYIEAVYASKIDYKINFDKKYLELFSRDYIICRKNGLGYLFSTGGIAGIWAYACQDPTIEAVQPKCQGRGDPECEVIAAPYKELVKMGYKPMRCRKLETLELDRTYQELNQIRPAKWAKNSLKSLIDSGFFKYSHGQVTYKGERFFLCEASFMYILERELKKVRGGLDILWDCSFDFGKRLAELAGRQDPNKFTADFFPALGFGDILALKKGKRYEIYIRCFPWTKWAKEIDFRMVRGWLSGLYSGMLEKEITFRLKKKGVTEGSFNLLLVS